MALPAINQPSLAWKIRDTTANLVAQYGIDFTTYSAATFTPTGTVAQNVALQPQAATGVGIDNTGNSVPVVVSVGSLFSETVPPFTKALVALGDTSPPVTITATAGQVVATFYRGIYPGSIAQTNQLGANKAAISVYLPTGIIMVWPGLVGNIPDGWLYCGGAAISRTVYSDLFNCIGTLYGEGDKASTFNVPDCRGQFLRGWDNGAGVNAGRNLGSKETDNVGPHYHTTVMGFDSGAGSTATMYWQTEGAGLPNLGSDVVTGSQGWTFQSANFARNSTGAAMRLARTSNQVNTTGGQETRPKNVAVNYMIKA